MLPVCLLPSWLWWVSWQDMPAAAGAFLTVAPGWPKLPGTPACERWAVCWKPLGSFPICWSIPGAQHSHVTMGVGLPGAQISLQSPRLRWLLSFPALPHGSELAALAGTGSMYRQLSLRAFLIFNSWVRYSKKCCSRWYCHVLLKYHGCLNLQAVCCARSVVFKCFPFWCQSCLGKNWIKTRYWS